jgi:hypothetical protein
MYFDDAVGAGWRLVTLVDPELDADLARWFTSIGGAVVPVGSGPFAVADVEGAYASWFGERGLVAAMQRPDFALYGTATEGAEVASIVRSLRAALVGVA